MKKKKLTIEVSEHDLICLKYAVSKLRTTDASEAMTFGSASMVAEELCNAWQATPHTSTKAVPQKKTKAAAR